MGESHASAPDAQLPLALAEDKLVELPVPERQYPASPEGIASFNAWWDGMLPEERAFLESIAHSDGVDTPHHR